MPGKEILPLDDYLGRLKAVLDCREDLFVVARTDAENFDEGLERAQKFAEAGADAVMVEGLTELNRVTRIREAVGTTPIVVNFLQGGKTPPVSLTDLSKLGASIVVYSTPCLFPAQEAIEDAMKRLLDADGLLSPDAGRIDLKKNNEILRRNAVAHSST